MLRKAKHLEGFKLHATDGDLGKVDEFYFDDQTWAVRYIIAETGGWMTGRLVLLSPHSVQKVDDQTRSVHLNITRQTIENSPPIETEKPVSRQYEKEFYKYYGWPAYWYGPALWGPAPYPIFGHAGTLQEPQPAREEEDDDPHLRSTHAVRGYYIHARDGEIGHASDFLIEDQTWAIRYLLVETRNWWPGKKVLVAADWITDVSWDRSSISVDLEREAIKQAPAFDPDKLFDREFEKQLFQYYKKEAYWDREAKQVHIAVSQEPGSGQSV